MLSLLEDLQVPKTDLNEFGKLTVRILQYIPAVLSEYKTKNNYRIYSSTHAGTTKFVRPINELLFTFDPAEFEKNLTELLICLNQIKNGKSNFSEEQKVNINKTLYTIQQSIGAGFDLLSSPNAARKHVGNRFEELIRATFTEIGIANKRTVLQIPYKTDEGEKVYKCENDLILSPFEKVQSSSSSLDENEVVVSVKTTSKDRMGKMFIDKLLLEKFVGHKQKVIGIFLNDVQRKESDNISFTLVSGLFMVYTNFLTELEGVYYLDAPPNSLKKPYSNHMGLFSDLITNDIWKLFQHR